VNADDPHKDGELKQEASPALMLVASGPHRTFVEVAANGGSEPRMTDAA